MADEAVTQNQGEAAPEAPRSFSLLASQRFGRNYVGDVPEPSAPESEPAHESEAQELPEDIENADELQDETEEQPEGQDEAEEQPDGGEEEEAVVSSLAELIESQQWDPEWVQGLRVPVKIDGKESEVALSEVLKSYQMSEAAEKRLTEAKEAQRQAKEALAAKQQELTGQFSVAAKLIQSAEGLLDADIAKVNWDELRRDDPAEYAAKHTELSQRRAQIEDMKREAIQSYQQTAYQQANESAAEMQERFQREEQQLLEKLPEWRDQAKAEQSKRQLVTYLTGQGFDPEDVANAVDHRLIVMAEKARKYDEMQGKTKTAMKKVAKIPKVLKPGAPKPPEAVKTEKVGQLRQRLQKSGNIEDAYRLLQARRGK